MKATVVTKRFIVCPRCGKDDSLIEHLFTDRRPVGPWYCDECGKAYKVIINADDSVSSAMLAYRVGQENGRSQILERSGA